MNSLPFKRLYFLLVVGLSALLVSNAVARPENAGTRAAFYTLQARAAGALDVHWNTKTGIPDFLAGRDPATQLPYTPHASERGNLSAIALGFLDANRALFGMSDASAQLQLRRIEVDLQLNYAHVRLDQVYQGIPVFGKQLVVHLDPQQHIVAVNGQFAPGIDVPTQPAISQSQAEEVARQDLLDVQLDRIERSTVKTNILSDKTRLMIHVAHSGKARLTWYVTILTTSPLGQWRYFVNARRPAVVHRFDSVANVKRRVTYSADNTNELPGRQLIDEGERSRDLVAQAAHDGAGKVYDYFSKTFQRDGIDGQGSPIVSTVHYGSSPQEAENAAWIGELQQMIYGDGGRIFQPLAFGLDVIAHELTHGVTENTAGLIYESQSGALNESYSDIFAALVDRDEWTVGEDIVNSPPFPVPYLRSLEDPTLGGIYDPVNPLAGVGQPGHVDDYANLPLSRRGDNGGVHVNSGIPNRAAFLLAQAIGKEKLEQIYYRALTQYLTPDAGFFDAARATVRAAQDLYGQAEVRAVRNAFSQVGLDLGEGDELPEPPVETTPGGGGRTPPPVQQLPAGCTQLMVNGGFESSSSWVEVSDANTAIIDPELPYTGARSAWLGGTDQEPLQYIYQDVRIPANAKRVQLSYYRLVHLEVSDLLGLFAGDAIFSSVVANTNGDVIGVVEELTSSQGDDAWRQAQFDLTQLAGKSVRLAFTAENPRGNISSFFVDDISLVACTTGSGPAAPPTSGQNLVYVQGTIVDADTGRGVAGAQVFILQPDLSATQAARDDSITSDEVLTLGVTDAKGFYQTETAIPRGQMYSAIVIARGFRPIVADDGIDIPSNATNPFQVDATLRKGR
ncbi:MAG: M4 family metallopeptidase [Anaerolineae bacterium]